MDQMNKQLSDKTKIFWFIIITIFLLSLSVLVYYIQNNNLSISADVVDYSGNWTIEEVTQCYLLDTKFFQVDNNNLLHLICRNSGNYTSGDDIHLYSYKRTISGWTESEAPFDNSTEQPAKISSDIDVLSNPGIAYQLYGSEAKYDIYAQENWQTLVIPNSKSLFIFDMKFDSKNNPYFLFGDINSTSGKIILKEYINKTWQDINIPDTILNTIGSFDIDSSDNLYLYGTTDGSNALAIYPSIDNYQEQKFTFDDFPNDDGFAEVLNAEYLYFQDFIIDSNNKIHALVRKFGMKNSKYHQNYYYLTNKNGSWENELVISDAIYDANKGVSMAIDTSNNPHISYTQTNSLKYKYFNGSTWQTSSSKVDGMSAQSYLKLAIDKNNISHIMFSKSANGNTIYHITKQIAPYKEFIGVQSTTSPTTSSDSNSTPTYTSTVIENTNDIDNDGVFNNDDPDVDGDGIPNESDITPSGETKIGSSFTNIPSRSPTTSKVAQVTSLVSTGASLWFNIIIAILISFCIGYYMFRRNIHGE